MSFLLPQLLSGLTHAMLLFLVASGLSLIFGVVRIINFAHASLAMLAAYLTTTLAVGLPLGPLNYYAAALLATAAVAALGAAIEWSLLRKIYDAPALYQLLLTFALVLILGDGVRFVWGPENRTGPNPAGLSGSVAVLGSLVPTYDLAILGVGSLVALGLWALLSRTHWGALVRAAREDPEMVGALGWDQKRLFTSVFALGSGLAGLAGALTVPRQGLSLGMDGAVIVEAFVVVVIGGLGSIPGAWLGAVLIGLLQAFGVLWLPRELHLPLVFLLMAGVLVVRPAGLLGRPEALAERAAEASPPRAAGRWSGGLVGVAIVLLVAVPPMLPPFFLWVLVEVCALALFAGSLQLLVGTGGMLSFGHAAYFGIGAYAAALLATRAGLAMPLGLAAAAAAGGLAALLLGALCVRATRIAFAMLTLAVAQVAYATIHQWYGLTGGDNGILGVWPTPWLAAPLRFYYVALLGAGAGFWVLGRLAASPFGLTLCAVREHPVRAAALGVPVRRRQLTAFAVAGVFAGLAGGLYVYAKGSAFPEYLGVPVSVEGLIMVLLGGLHSLPGAAIGAAMFKGLESLVSIYTDYWQAVLGFILVAVVLICPRGLLGAGGLGGARKGGST
jgi:branched-chain amino acid transport system permease protein